MYQANPLMGVALHAVGALSAASCYTPQKKTPRWSWEIYWISQATFAWLILPILGAVATVPDYWLILAACPTEVMFKWVALGLSAIPGTVVPPVWTPNDGFVYRLDTLFDSTSAVIVLVGIVLAVLGIFVCGVAGSLRERSAGGEMARGSGLRRGLR